MAPFSDVIERVTFEPNSLVKIPANNEKKVTVKIKFFETTRTDKNYITEVKIRSTINTAVSTVVGLSTYVVSPRDIIDITLDIGSILDERYRDFSYGRCGVYSDGWLILEKQVSVT